MTGALVNLSGAGSTGPSVGPGPFRESGPVRGPRLDQREDADAKRRSRHGATPPTHPRGLEPKPRARRRFAAAHPCDRVDRPADSDDSESPHPSHSVFLSSGALRWAADSDDSESLTNFRWALAGPAQRPPEGRRNLVDVIMRH